MFARICSKTTLALLIVSLLVQSSFFLYPQRAEAATANCVGVVAGAIAAALGINAAKETVGVVVGSSDSQINAVSAGSGYGTFFNDCILKPMAINLARTMVRQISNSIVEWINNGFDGKPKFITDLRGMLVKSADETIGEFIYGSDLNFLCQPFAARIRLALATKHIQSSFPQQVRCTLTDITGNINNFAQNNGGYGWNNWLEITTEPQNNVYGAYLRADTQLTANIQGRLDKINTMINRNGGFLDFTTCDLYETSAQVAARLSTNPATVSTNTGTQSTGFQSFNTGLQTIQFGEGTVLNVPQQQATTFTNQSASAFSTQPKCLKESVKTPGTLIQGQATKVLGGWADQLNLATEIDQIIGALISKFSEKMIEGSKGFLGLSGSGSYATQSINYNQAIAAGNDLSNPENAGLSDLQTDYNTTVATQTPINTTTNSSVNYAAGMPASLSSSGIGSVAFLTDGDMSTAAATSDQIDPWIEVDLGMSITVGEIKIWTLPTSDASTTLGAFKVIVSETSGGTDWVSPTITSMTGAPNPFVISPGQPGRYIRIAREQNDYSCLSATCYYPLEIAEIEVAETMGTQPSSYVPTSPTGPSVQTEPVTFESPIGNTTINRTTSPSFNLAIPVTVANDTTIDSLTVELYYSGSVRAWDSVFSNAGIAIAENGSLAWQSPGGQSGLNFQNVDVGPSSNTEVRFTGMALSGATTGTYEIRLISREASVVTGQRSVNFVIQ